MKMKNNDMDKEKLLRLVFDMIENKKKMEFICTMTGLSEESVLEMPEDDFEKYLNVYDRSKKWMNN